MKRLFISILAVLLVGSATAQVDSFTELLNMSEKKLNAMIGVGTGHDYKSCLNVTDGMGGCADLSRVDLKKVALVTYNVGSEWDASTSISGGGGFFVGGRFYNESIDILKESFASRGIELITYSDMSAEQKAIMNDKDGDSWLPDSDPKKYGKLQKRLNKSSDEINEEWAPMDEGTFNWYMDRMPYRIQMYSYVIDDLGVDAILLVSQRITLSKTILFEDIDIALIGPNPIPKVEGKSYPGLSHMDGNIYNGVRLHVRDGVRIGTSKIKRGWTNVTFKDGVLDLEGYTDMFKLLMDKFWAEYDWRVQVSKEANMKQKNKK